MASRKPSKDTMRKELVTLMNPNVPKIYNSMHGSHFVYTSNRSEVGKIYHGHQLRYVDDAHALIPTNLYVIHFYLQNACGASDIPDEMMIRKNVNDLIKLFSTKPDGARCAAIVPHKHLQGKVPTSKAYKIADESGRKRTIKGCEDMSLAHTGHLYYPGQYMYNSRLSFDWGHEIGIFDEILRQYRFLTQKRPYRNNSEEMNEAYLWFLETVYSNMDSEYIIYVEYKQDVPEYRSAKIIERYNKYKEATTLRQAFRLGCTMADLKRDIHSEYIEIIDPKLDNYFDMYELTKGNTDKKYDEKTRFSIPGISNFEQLYTQRNNESKFVHSSYKSVQSLDFSDLSMLHFKSQLINNHYLYLEPPHGLGMKVDKCNAYSYRQVDKDNRQHISMQYFLNYISSRVPSNKKKLVIIYNCDPVLPVEYDSISRGRVKDDKRSKRDDAAELTPRHLFTERDYRQIEAIRNKYNILGQKQLYSFLTHKNNYINAPLNIRGVQLSDEDKRRLRDTEGILYGDRNITSDMSDSDNEETHTDSAATSDMSDSDNEETDSETDETDTGMDVVLNESRYTTNQDALFKQYQERNIRAQRLGINPGEAYKVIYPTYDAAAAVNLIGSARTCWWEKNNDETCIIS